MGQACILHVQIAEDIKSCSQVPATEQRQGKASEDLQHLATAERYTCQRTSKKVAQSYSSVIESLADVCCQI